MSIKAPSTESPTPAWAMYRAIVGIGIACALLIVAVHRGTAERIRQNEAEALQKAIASVLPAARTVEVVIEEDGRLAVATGETAPLPAFLGFDASGQLTGAAVTAQGMGYQDNIRIIYAYSFDAAAIDGFDVLDSKETPGLGDKIEKDEKWLANFERLDAALSDDGTTLRHAIVTVPSGEKTSPWQLDAISGATVSSDAIGEILNLSAGAWVPVLERDARRLTLPAPEGEAQ